MNLFPSLVLIAAAGTALAEPVTSPADPARRASFDILSAEVRREGEQLTFTMATAGPLGVELPAAIGALNGAAVHAYVWPTSLDPSTVGFAEGTGILALTATSHPDFDDTPLYDENGDNDPANDGAGWHSHWVVLTPTETCGPGALAVRDISEGEEPDLPATWPGLPLFIDSPDLHPVLSDSEIRIDVALPGAAGLSFDAVTAALRVNADLHAPLLCVTDVFDIASGDLSLPGKVD